MEHLIRYGQMAWLTMLVSMRAILLVRSMEMMKEKNLECSSADSMVIQRDTQTASLTERQWEDSLLVMQMVMKKAPKLEYSLARSMAMQMALLMVRHLVGSSDKMMASMKAS